MNIDTDIQKIDDLLSRSIKEVLPTFDGLKKKLLSGEKLRVYIGTDATGVSLHLGHATNYMILEKFRRLGHEVIFLIGDFTSRIGDPTDKTATRVELTREQVVENVKTWLAQVKPIISFDDPVNPVKVMYNNDWLSKLTFEDVIKIASNFTVQGMLERDMFEKRIEEGKVIHLHEFFYPLMQGYDSVVMDVDVELCGNDQKFNALAGRMLQKRINNKEKFVLITTLLENPKTGEKMMSKSLGTGVFLDSNANDMFGGIMAQPDENMHQLFVDCTYLELKEIEELLKNSDNRANKLRLAHEIVTIYHGKNMADSASLNWEESFSLGKIPTDVLDTFEYNPTKTIIEILIASGLVSSKSEFIRLIDSGAVEHMEDKQKITDIKSIATPGTYRIGKKRFLRIK
jgi:tyrosyl-tRNA synthetase